MRRSITILFAMAVTAGPPALAAPTAPVPPPDWRMELVAEAPAVRHPSVVCSAPDGRVFVAEDPMDISAPANATGPTAADFAIEAPPRKGEPEASRMQP